MIHDGHRVITKAHLECFVLSLAKKLAVRTDNCGISSDISKNDTHRGFRPDPEDSEVCCCNKTNISENRHDEV